jgi:hypothetical protein
MKMKGDLVDVIWNGPMTSQHEGLILGNGDLGALVYGNQYEIKMTFGKNDCWDSRYESNIEADILKQDDLITLLEKYGLETLERHNLTQDFQLTIPVSKKPIPTKYRGIYVTPAYWFKNEFFRPCPKRVCEVIFASPGLSTAKMKSRLKIMEGVFEIEIEYNSKAKVRLEGFIWAEGNIFCLRYQVQGQIPWGRLVLRKYPDAVDNSIPDPILTFPPPGDVVTVTQKIPGDEYIDPFQWSVSAKGIGSRFNMRTERMDQRYASFIHLPLKDVTADYFFAVSTSRDTKAETNRRSHEIVEYASKIGYDTLKTSQKEWWSSFWDRSSITLEDKDLEQAWYRDLYRAACYIKEGKTAPGLYGNMIGYDASMWHGNYHMTMDQQMPFYPVLITNHCDMMEPHIQSIIDFLPKGELLAQKIFGLDGIYIDMAIIPFTGLKQINVNNLYGRWLAMTGWTIFHFWWYYKYTCDKKWLADKGYKIIKRAAQFYWNYMDKYQKKFNGDIYPSNRDESRSWERNPSWDIAAFHSIFKAAIKSSEILGIDTEWRIKWRKALENLPAYPTFKKNGEEILAPSEDQKHETGSYTGSWLIWPAEAIDPDSESKYVKMVKKTFSKINSKSRISSVFPHISIAMERLGIKESYNCIKNSITNEGTTSFRRREYAEMNIKNDEFAPIYGGYPSPGGNAEDVIHPLLISELLLQSYNELIRLFPVWPKNKKASFTTLRAEGGFLVSSKIENGNIGTTEIYSTFGGTCRILSPWNKETILCDEKPLKYKKEKNIICFETVPNKKYHIQPIYIIKT